ncbi:hypothetical protein LX32DRAFT_250941 [Colletotrichum zoysiae]|uniref:Uncharacterized protein n=1 Tax=Colletotrichum zoysiae TaxID=1216348 RepID=A0AAD9H4Q9_9PEZI|nr:hypothetical protein LX32DRAFT_250941 [Colletotrichum zoysiae]
MRIQVRTYVFVRCMHQEYSESGGLRIECVGFNPAPSKWTLPKREWERRVVCVCVSSQAASRHHFRGGGDDRKIKIKINKKEEKRLGLPLKEIHAHGLTHTHTHTLTLSHLTLTLDSSVTGFECEWLVHWTDGPVDVWCVAAAAGGWKGTFAGTYTDTTRQTQHAYTHTHTPTHTRVRYTTDRLLWHPESCCTGKHNPRAGERKTESRTSLLRSSTHVLSVSLEKPSASWNEQEQAQAQEQQEQE